MKEGRKPSLWEGKKVVEKKGALQDILKSTSEEVRPKASKVEDAKKDLDRAFAEEQEDYVKGKIQEIERAHESYKNGFSLIHSERNYGRKGSSRCQIRASCPNECIKLWKEHFEGLPGQPPVGDDKPLTRVFDIFAHQNWQFYCDGVTGSHETDPR